MNVSFQYSDFYGYVNKSLISDLNNLCTYVDENKQLLNLDLDTWNKSRDCISDQLSRVSKNFTWNSYYTNNERIFLRWVKGDVDRRLFLGVDPNTNLQKYPYGREAFLCTNFSLMTESSLVRKDTAYMLKLIKNWKHTYDRYGCSNSSVNILVGSNKFSFPLLANDVIQSIFFALVISGAGFVALIFLFTFDIMLTVVGTLLMILTIIVTLLFVNNFVSTIVDLLDIVVLVAIIGNLVDFPVHSILDFRNKRLCEDDDSIQSRTNTFKTFYMRIAEIPITLFYPMLLMIICSIPLLFATFILLQKFGVYTIIISIVSYTCTVLLLSLILPLTFQTHCYDYMFRRSWM